MVPAGPSSSSTTGGGVAGAGRPPPARPRSSTASGSTVSTLAPASPRPVAVEVAGVNQRRSGAASSTRSATWSSTKRVVASPAMTVGWRRSACRKPVLVWTPSIRSSARAARGLGQRVGEVGGGCVHDDLGEQGVEAGAGAVAGVAEGVGAVAGAGGHLERGEHAARRACRAVGGHRLHVDAALHGDPAWRRHRRLIQSDLGEPATARQLELGPHEVDAEHLLGDGVLDLQPRVGFDEDVAAGVGVDEELERPEAAIADLGRHPHRVGEEGVAGRGVEVGRRGDLDELLVPTLEAALALPQVADRAPSVADDLHLDVPGPSHELLGEQRAVAERRRGLRAATFVQPGELIGRGDDPAAAATAAGRRLEHQRPVGTQRSLERGGVVDGDATGRAAQHGDAEPIGQRPGRSLVAEQGEHLGRWPDERDAGLGAAGGEAGVLGEEPVAGVDRVGPRLGGELQHPLDVEVGGRPVGLERPGVVGLAGVQ